MRTGGPDRSSVRRAPTPERGAAGDRAFDERTPFWRSPTPIAVISGLLLIATARAAVSGLWNHTLASPTGDTDQGLGRSILGV